LWKREKKQKGEEFERKQQEKRGKNRHRFIKCAIEEQRTIQNGVEKNFGAYSVRTVCAK